MGMGGEGRELKSPPNSILAPLQNEGLRGGNNCKYFDLNSLIIKVILNIYRVENIISYNTSPHRTKNSF